MVRTARLSLDEIVEHDTLAAALFLLDVTLSVLGPTAAVSIRPTEVEAYLGGHNSGSHVFRRHTARNSSAFGVEGRICVYSVYDMRHRANIVCGPTGSTSAVLLRAEEVARGIEVARARRPGAQRGTGLVRGLAKLYTVLRLTREDDEALPGEAGDRVDHDPPGPEDGCHRPWRGWRRLSAALLGRR